MLALIWQVMAPTIQGFLADASTHGIGTRTSPLSVRCRIVGHSFLDRSQRLR
ncbi:hypothetical protein B0G74_6289 [Paraburkholderia sp. BL9I2N2]|jgi:hypothetical protein|nr:hypothetical protein B0G74_6289 [Paraburkholderia sp. BL9I2N2]